MLQSVNAFEESGRAARRRTLRRRLRKVKTATKTSVAFGGGYERYDPKSWSSLNRSEERNNPAITVSRPTTAEQHSERRRVALDSAAEAEKLRQAVLAEAARRARKSPGPNGGGMGRPISAAFAAMGVSGATSGRLAEWRWEGQGDEITVDDEGRFDLSLWNEGRHPRLIGGRAAPATPVTALRRAEGPSSTSSGLRITVPAREFVLESDVDLSARAPNRASSQSPSRGQSPSRTRTSPLSRGGARSVMKFTASATLVGAERAEVNRGFKGTVYLDGARGSSGTNAASEGGGAAANDTSSTQPRNLIPACSPSLVRRAAANVALIAHLSASVVAPAAVQ